MNISQEDFRWMVEGMTADLIRLLMERDGYTMPEAFSVVYGSATYRALLHPESHFYYQSPGYVYSYLKTELETGCLQ